MAYGIVFEFGADVSRKDYDAVNDKLGFDMNRGQVDWPAGIMSHGAGPIAGGWVVSEVWESKAAQEAWMANELGPALAAVGVAAPVRVMEIDLVSYHTP